MVFCEEKKVSPGLWSDVRIVNKTTAKSLQAGIFSPRTQLLLFLISHPCEYGQKKQDLKLGETVQREHDR